MKTTNLKDSKNKSIHAVIWVVGDNYSNKDILLDFLLSPNLNNNDSQSLPNLLNVHYSSILGTDKLIQIYDFPTDRFIRQYLDLYFDILPKPSLILYCSDLQSSQREIQQWVHLIQDQTQSIVFISDIHTVSQRLQLVKKISYFFQKEVIDYIYLPQLDKNSLYTCLCNLDHGLSLKNYIRKVNTWSAFKSLLKRLSYFFKNQPQATSVV